MRNKLLGMDEEYRDSEDLNHLDGSRTALSYADQ
jgi:hypothetical protein